MTVQDTSQGTLSITPEDQFGARPVTVSVIGATGNVVTPIVVTVAAHTFTVGSLVSIAGSLGNTVVNGQRKVSAKTATTLTLTATDGSAITGDGAWTSGGTITPLLKELPFTGESLETKTDTVKSAEIVSDGTNRDVIRVNLESAGQTNHEFKFGAYDDPLEAVLRSTFTAQIIVSSALFSMAASDQSLNRAAYDFAANGFVAGNWINTSGFASAVNNNYFKIASVAVGKLVLTSPIGGSPVVDAAATPTIIVAQAATLINGTSPKSFCLERGYSSALLSLFVGQVPSGFTLSINARQKVTIDFDWIGKKDSSGTGSIGTGTPLAAAANAVMNATDDLRGVMQNGAAFTVPALSLKVGNNAALRAECGTLGPIGYRTGTLDAMSDFSGYFQASTVYDQYLAFTTTSIAFLLEKTDATKHSYIFELPEGKLTKGVKPLAGQNQDVVQNFSFDSRRKASESAQVRISRFGS